MSLVSIGIIIFILALITALLFGFIISQYTGWIYFEMKYGDNFKVTTTKDKMKKVKFRKCIFSITSTDESETKTKDVSEVLNNMLQAYSYDKFDTYVFKLADPGLYPYAFKISGLTDADTLKKNNGLPDKWDQSKNMSLKGYYKIK